MNNSGYIRDLNDIYMFYFFLQFRVLCSLAMAVVALDALPEKLNPVVRPLMDVIKKEENESLQVNTRIIMIKIVPCCVNKIIK